MPPSVAWTGTAVRVVDQRALPGELVLRDLPDVDAVVDAIATLAVRGANVIGTTGAFGVVLGLRAGLPLDEVAERVAGTRPTAVNLRVAVQAVVDAVRSGRDPLEVALALVDADRDQCRRIGEAGRDELVDRHRLLTHCNTGRLATTGWGTALGIVHAKAEAGHPVRVLATETRPLRQGARLTAWELERSGVDVEVIVDAAAAGAILGGRVDAVVVGADRIAANGDTANKVGTLGLALAADRAGVPFYVAATLNAVDLAVPDASHVPVELRRAAEVLDRPGDVDVPVWNPAFDLTPGGLVTGIVTEVGVLRPPYTSTLADAVRASDRQGER
ncbi:S-methyl-5-thioribose-1-phosphate isomerase [Cellulomonas oligotrophica]|uniref:Methylthioribose-1-phosphate isomerase n=1 Tax=Cellulomonas oligotrophica TaxID=931536 RepID=A0A7Y9FFV6_9CELL|nr:S-methyl-5-thioribose-1-phosphate isomerase [Cellulomonas oligotrophica]NYD86137.1 methylthioribose-1-phosphate isomerase [Cellulomonas oligotrophica]